MDERFERFVVPEVAVLYRVAVSLVRRREDAEDLVQETLLRAYRAMGTFDGAHPRAWLLTILRNARVNQQRRRRPSLLAQGDDDPRWLTLADDHVDPEAIVIGQLFDATVDDALASLPQVNRAVIDLVDLQGLSYAEAATALGVPVGTVMSRLHRGRRRIRNRVVAQRAVRAGRRP